MTQTGTKVSDAKPQEPVRDWLSKGMLLPPEYKEYQCSATLDDDLLVSAPSKQGAPGGLYYLKKSGWFGQCTVSTVDLFETSGLWLQHNLFLRSLQHDNFLQIAAYSDNGNVWTILNSEFGSIHDIRIFNDKLYFVSTNTNEVGIISMTGKVEKKYSFPPGGHTWHVNSLGEWNGRLVVSCFGKFESPPDWIKEAGKRGLVFDLETQENLWDGLSRPHSPEMDKQGRKYVCDSLAQRVLVDEGNGKIRELNFPGTFPKGLAWGKKHLYLGLCKFRWELPGVKRIEEARIAILDPDTFKELGQIPLPCSEIYNIAVIS